MLMVHVINCLLKTTYLLRQIAVAQGYANSDR
jgi:hypothetical protein